MSCVMLTVLCVMKRFPHRITHYTINITQRRFKYNSGAAGSPSHSVLRHFRRPPAFGGYPASVVGAIHVSRGSLRSPR